MIYTEYEADEAWLDTEASKPEPWWQTPELLPHEQQWMAEMNEFCGVAFGMMQAMAKALESREEATNWDSLERGESGQGMIVADQASRIPVVDELDVLVLDFCAVVPDTDEELVTGQWEWPAGPLQDWDWYDDDPLEPDEGADDEQA